MKASTTKKKASLADYAAVRFEPSLTMAQVDQAETTAKEMGIRRGLVSITLTKSRDEILSGFRSDPDSLMALIEDLQAYRDYLGAGKSLTESTIIRLMSVAAEFAAEEAQS